MYVTGVGQLPTLGGYVQQTQSVSITTQTYPISQGQSVSVIYSTDHFKTSHTVALNYDQTVGNNTQWYCVFGQMPPNADLLFYIQATTTNGITLYDNNSSQNFGYVTRFSPANRRGPILQWFATPYSTILKRLPEVAKAGYCGIYLPPPQKSGGGGFSVGYNPFDRFDLGDRLQAGTVRTQYGTTSELQEVLNLAHRLGLEVYADMVTNHNDDRASTNIASYPNLLPEDFHIFSTANPTNNQIDFNNAPNLGFNVLNYDLSGLADIAHEDGNLVETGPFNLPSFASFNSNGKPTFVRQPLTNAYYPGGIPVTEDVREYLKRWGWFLVTQFGFDGFRIDAVRETDPGFFNTLNTQAGFNVSRGGLLPQEYGLNPNLLIFGEDDNSDNYELREYAKTGMNLLDFPLFNTIGSVFNSNGYADLGATLSNGYGIDSATSLGFQNGGLSNDIGVSFVQSHDYGPPTSNNLAYAFTLTRPGNSIVFYDGNNLQPGNYNQFPKPGRADSIGNADAILTKIVDARARFGRGTLVNRFISPNCYIYERQVNGQGVMLIGLNNRGDSTSITQTVSTAFAPGTMLEDLSGQAQVATVGGGGVVTITVPANGSSTQANNGTGYVLYAPVSPKATTGVSLIDAVTNTVLPPTTVPTPAGTYGTAGSFQASTLTHGLLSLTVGTDSSGATCVAQLDGGVAPVGIQLLSNTPEGLADRFFTVPGSAGSFAISGLNVAALQDGLHVLRVRVFSATGTGPGVFQDFVTFFYLNRSILANVDGNLAEYGTPLVTQVNTPSSQSNRLDELFVSNDDAYLYIGLAGTVDPSENFTNGLVTFLDTSPGTAGGISNAYSLKDDSGPAQRLLSNAQAAFPTGFNARFGVASFRQSSLHSSPEATFTGGLSLSPPIGAQAGVFTLDPSNSHQLPGIPSKMVWQPRSSPFGPQLGLEVAIPLSSLFSQKVSVGATINLLSYLCTTGETGTTLNAYDPSRGSLGGRPASISYVANQVLPPQPGLSLDPGRTPVTLTKFASYKLALAYGARNVLIQDGPLVPVNGGFTETVVIDNAGTQPLVGPIYLLDHLPKSVTWLDATGTSLQKPPIGYEKLPVTSIAAHQKITLTLHFATPLRSGFRNGFSLEAGGGIP